MVKASPVSSQKVKTQAILQKKQAFQSMRAAREAKRAAMRSVQTAKQSKKTCLLYTSAGKISIYDVSKALKKAGITSSRQLILGLSFLYSVNIVEFEEANIWVKK